MKYLIIPKQPLSAWQFIFVEQMKSLYGVSNVIVCTSLRCAEKCTDKGKPFRAIISDSADLLEDATFILGGQYEEAVLAISGRDLLPDEDSPVFWDQLLVFDCSVKLLALRQKMISVLGWPSKNHLPPEVIAYG